MLSDVNSHFAPASLLELVWYLAMESIVACACDMAYLAGVIDSDGSIGVRRSTYAMRVRGDAKQATYQARVMVRQVDHGAIDLLTFYFGGTRYPQASQVPNGRTLDCWEVHSAAVGRVLPHLVPFLRIKRERALNALEVCRLNSDPNRRRFEFPDPTPGEPMVTVAEAARFLGKSEMVVRQATQKRSVPFVKDGRRTLIPKSYLPVWAKRGSTPQRKQSYTDALEAYYRRAKELNRVGM